MDQAVADDDTLGVDADATRSAKISRQRQFAARCVRVGDLPSAASGSAWSARRADASQADRGEWRGERSGEPGRKSCRGAPLAAAWVVTFVHQISRVMDQRLRLFASTCTPSTRSGPASHRNASSSSMPGANHLSSPSVSGPPSPSRRPSPHLCRPRPRRAAAEVFEAHELAEIVWQTAIFNTWNRIAITTRMVPGSYKLRAKYVASAAAGG